MQTIKLEIEDSKLNIILNIIQNLKEDVIAKYEIVHNEQKNYGDRSETQAFSSHSANLIEEWKDDVEDDIWK